MLSTPAGFTIEGAWTKAGIGSCLRIKGPTKSNDFLFDCGVFNESLTSSNRVFISHGHTDHIGGCITHARARGLSLSPAKYYIPAEITESLENARKAFSVMDGKEIQMEIISVSPGDVIKCDDGIEIIVFKTYHRVTSQGYGVYHKSNKRALKQEYVGLSSEKIKEIKSSGSSLYVDSQPTLEIVYTGDTDMRSFLDQNNLFILSTYILITELTYLEGHQQKAIESTHMHLDDIIKYSNLFESIPILFFVHVSPRYGPSSRIINIMREKLPDFFIEKSYVSLKSFGSKEFATALSSSQYSSNRVGYGWANKNY